MTTNNHFYNKDRVQHQNGFDYKVFDEMLNSRKYDDVADLVYKDMLIAATKNVAVAVDQMFEEFSPKSVNQFCKAARTILGVMEDFQKINKPRKAKKDADFLSIQILLRLKNLAQIIVEIQESAKKDLAVQFDENAYKGIDISVDSASRKIAYGLANCSDECAEILISNLTDPKGKFRKK